MYIHAALKHDSYNGRNSNQILLNDKDGSTHSEVHTGGEICYLRLPRCYWAYTAYEK